MLTRHPLLRFSMIMPFAALFIPARAQDLSERALMERRVDFARRRGCLDRRHLQDEGSVAGVTSYTFVADDDRSHGARLLHHWRSPRPLAVDVGQSRSEDRRAPTTPAGRRHVLVLEATIS
jgi:hypothetical protein